MDAAGFRAHLDHVELQLPALSGRCALDEPCKLGAQLSGVLARAADALDGYMQAEHGLESDCKNEQRQEGRDRQGSEARRRDGQRAGVQRVGLAVQLVN